MDENNQETKKLKGFRIFQNPFWFVEIATIGFGVAVGGGIAPFGFKIVGATIGILLGVLCIGLIRSWVGHTRPVDKTITPLPMGWKGYITYFVFLGMCLYFIFLALNQVIYQPDKRLEGVVALISSITIGAGFVFLWTKDLVPQQDSGISLGHIIICFGFVVGSFGAIALGSIYTGILGVITFGAFAIIGILKRKRVN